MKKTLLTLGVFLLFSVPAYAAYTGDISINYAPIKFSEQYFLEGSNIRIYASTINSGNIDLLGTVRFFDNGKQIDGDQPVSIYVGKTDDVFVDWVPSTFGTHRISAKIYPTKPDIDNPNNNWVVDEIYVERDTDHDGIPNQKDDDMDGDGVPNNEDAFPLSAAESKDTDGDGIGDNADPDADNDGILDNADGCPLDPSDFVDTDKDGICNNTDEDDDNDGLSDFDEIKLGTESLNPDTDGDKSLDGKDAFPLDSKEWLDTDKDGIGNNTDIDDDNDGIPDETDPFPLNKAPVIKLEDYPSMIQINDPFTFDASPSYDEDGKIIEYSWRIDDKTFNTPKATYTFTKTGEYDIQFKLKDTSGEIQEITLKVKVVNLKLYIQIVVSIIAILLALLILFKYIAKAKKYEKRKANKN